MPFLAVALVGWLRVRPVGTPVRPDHSNPSPHLACRAFTLLVRALEIGQGRVQARRCFGFRVRPHIAEPVSNANLTTPHGCQGRVGGHLQNAHAERGLRVFGEAAQVVDALPRLTPKLCIATSRLRGGCLAALVQPIADPSTIRKECQKSRPCEAQCKHKGKQIATRYFLQDVGESTSDTTHGKAMAINLDGRNTSICLICLGYFWDIIWICFGYFKIVFIYFLIFWGYLKLVLGYVWDMLGILFGYVLDICVWFVWDMLVISFGYCWHMLDICLTYV